MSGQEPINAQNATTGTPAGETTQTPATVPPVQQGGTPVETTAEDGTHDRIDPREYGQNTPTKRHVTSDA